MSDGLYSFVNIYFLKFPFLYPNGIMLYFIHGGSFWRHFHWMFGCVLEANSYIGEHFYSKNCFIRLVVWVKVDAAFI